MKPRAEGGGPRLRAGFSNKATVLHTRGSSPALVSRIPALCDVIPRPAAAPTRGALPSARGRCLSRRRFRFRSGAAASASARSGSGRMEARVAQAAARLARQVGAGVERLARLGRALLRGGEGARRSSGGGGEEPCSRGLWGGLRIRRKKAGGVFGAATAVLLGNEQSQSAAAEWGSFCAGPEDPGWPRRGGSPGCSRRGAVALERCGGEGGWSQLLPGAVCKDERLSSQR